MSQKATTILDLMHNCSDTLTFFGWEVSLVRFSSSTTKTNFFLFQRRQIFFISNVTLKFCLIKLAAPTNMGISQQGCASLGFHTWYHYCLQNKHLC